MLTGRIALEYKWYVRGYHDAITKDTNIQNFMSEDVRIMYAYLLGLYNGGGDEPSPPGTPEDVQEALNSRINAEDPQS